MNELYLSLYESPFQILKYVCSIRQIRFPYFLLPFFFPSRKILTSLPDCSTQAALKSELS